MEVVLVLAVLAVAVVLIAGPLRRRSPTEPARSPELADLEAAKEAKFREIRDAELDYRTGKLSRDDWRALDASLRAEAIEILRRLDALTPAPPEDKNL
jgi:type II secretory pathway component PulM